MRKVEVKQRGQALLNNPLLNKGMAFSQEERERFGLHGLLPYHVATIEEQLLRRYDNFKKQPNALAKYLFLSSLQNNNEVLFYRLVSEHIAEMLPYIYTPTVGDASLSFSSIYTQRRGLYLSYPHRNQMEKMIGHLSQDQIDIMVVTDGERILGLGDLGANGMVISVGKIALYSLFGGFYPAYTLPIFLDVGTNNQALLADPLYLGWRHPRIEGKEYDDFIELFIQTIKKRYPKVLLQWEDFSREHALPLLKRYQNELCSFNDDIQGTAAVVLSAILCAVEMKKEKLSEQRMVIFGAGSAGLGIARMLLQALQEAGIPEPEALKCLYLVDRDGLIHTQLSTLLPEQRYFARDHREVAQLDPSFISLLDLIHFAQPTVLIGVSAQPGAFSEDIVKAMAKYVDRPIICPLSNPTHKAEAEPDQLIQWTEGEAIIATGSPFDPVFYRGEVYPIAQCNNVYIFPGVGLGAVIAQATRISDKMFLKAASCLKDHSPVLEDPFGPLFPRLEDLAKITQSIAIEVGLTAQEEGCAPKTSRKDLEDRLNEYFWKPHYPEYI